MTNFILVLILCVVSVILGAQGLPTSTGEWIIIVVLAVLIAILILLLAVPKGENMKEEIDEKEN